MGLSQLLATTGGRYLRQYGEETKLACRGGPARTEDQRSYYSLARHLDKSRGLLKIIWAAVFAKFSLDVWADMDGSG